MGRAIVREPAAFLFDEPLSHLDAKLRVQMRLEIQKLHRRLGTTSLYVTHDQVEAMTLAHRMVVMNAGRAEQVGTPLEVYGDPASVFVAGFIGSPAMNFVTGKGAAGGRVMVEGSGAMAAYAPVAEGQQVTLGMRPEHLAPTPDDASAISGQIEMVEPLGADTLVHVSVGAYNVTARLPHSTQVQVGEHIALSVAPESVYLFDAETGQRIRGNPA